MLLRAAYIAALTLTLTACATASGPQAKSSLPGESYADKQLAKDALMGVLPAATHKAGCQPKQFKLVSSEILQQPAHEADGVVSWKEKWSLELCEKKVQVPITFHYLGAGKGTNWLIDNSAVQVKAIE